MNFAVSWPRRAIAARQHRGPRGALPHRRFAVDPERGGRSRAKPTSPIVREPGVGADADISLACSPLSAALVAVAAAGERTTGWCWRSNDPNPPISLSPPPLA